MKRTLAFAPKADLLWLETKNPDLKQAQGFASEIHSHFPGKSVQFDLCFSLPRFVELTAHFLDARGRWLVYNLSPSFNWGAHGFTPEQLESFVWDLGRSGFVLQLISLAGLHSNAVVTGRPIFLHVTRSSHTSADNLPTQQRSSHSASRRRA